MSLKHISEFFYVQKVTETFKVKGIQKVEETLKLRA